MTRITACAFLVNSTQTFVCICSARFTPSPVEEDPPTWVVAVVGAWIALGNAEFNPRNPVDRTAHRVTVGPL